MDVTGRLSAPLARAGLALRTGKAEGVPAFLARKPARRFQTYDADGDGFVGRSDFVAADHRPAEEFDHGPGSAGSWLLGPDPHDVRTAVQQSDRIPARHRIRRGA
jgi:hypothetical protein